MSSDPPSLFDAIDFDRSLRILHTADWHLGKFLCEQSREDEHEAFLDWLNKLICERKIDVLLIAGDVFDSANPPHSSTTLLYRFLTQLHQQTSCEVVIVAGNHDSAKQLESVAPLLKTHRVHVLGMIPEVMEKAVIRIGDPVKLVVAAVPFLRDRDVRTSTPGESAEDIQRAMVAGIARVYEQVVALAVVDKPSNVPCIATGHLTTLGSTPSDSERAIHGGGLGAFPSSSFPTAFDYVALGHLHRPQSADVKGRVRYSGSPIALSFSEAADTKVVELLEFDEGVLTRQEAIPVPQLRVLLRLECEATDVESYLKQYEWPSSELGCLVELTLSNVTAQIPSAEQIRGYVAKEDVQILQVRTSQISERKDLDVERAMAVDEAIQFLREEPRRVFEKRLELEKLDEEQTIALRLEFDKLLDEIADTGGGA